MAGVTDGGDNNELVLYHFLGSSYSQKAIIALFEKKLTFKSSFVNLAAKEHLEPWFLKLNPEGKVPVLKDGDSVVPDSACIIRYLDKKFKGRGSELIPTNEDEAHKVLELEKLLNTIPFPIITFGCVFHPQLTENRKMSEKEIEFRSLESRSADRSSYLENMMKKHPEFTDIYKKKQKQFAMFASLKEIDVLKRALSSTESILDVVESELAQHTEEKSDWWVCSKNFTICDVIMTLLLHRLEFTGFWNHFFAGNKRPHLVKYYTRIQQRESFKKTYCEGKYLVQ